jgi:hypothetical protein
MVASLVPGKTSRKATSHSGFYCQECGHGFKTIKAAEKASSGANLVLFEAERAYLLALGWTERPVTFWVSPKGTEMTQWAALAQAKLGADYDATG